MRNGSSKSVRVRNDPVGHQAAITAPSHPEPGFIYTIKLAQHKVQGVQQITIISSPKVPPAGLSKILTITKATARIGHEHGISLRKERLHFMAIRASIHRMGSAVNL
ncbi:hypothetical protein D1872_253710 [compost metagenome]